MFDTSADILNLVLAIGILLIAMLVGWLLFYFVMIVKDIRQTTRSLKQKIELLDDLIKTIKEKIEKSASYFGILVELVSKLVTHFKKDKGQTRPRRRNITPNDIE